MQYVKLAGQRDQRFPGIRLDIGCVHHPQPGGSRSLSGDEVQDLE
jgi:hypothetical protein